MDVEATKGLQVEEEVLARDRICFVFVWIFVFQEDNEYETIFLYVVLVRSALRRIYVYVLEVGFDSHICFGIRFFPRKPNIRYLLVFQPNILSIGFGQDGVRRGMVIHTLLGLIHHTASPPTLAQVQQLHGGPLARDLIL